VTRPRCNVRWHHILPESVRCEPLDDPVVNQVWEQLGQDIKAHRDAELNRKSQRARLPQVCMIPDCGCTGLAHP